MVTENRKVITIDNKYIINNDSKQVVSLLTYIIEDFIKVLKINVSEYIRNRVRINEH